eukprot:6309055-Alexandrium_andersonii.AAC.1
MTVLTARLALSASLQGRVAKASAVRTYRVSATAPMIQACQQAGSAYTKKCETIPRDRRTEQAG